MDVYVLGGSQAKKLSEFCGRVRVRKDATAEDFLQNGFTNAYEPTLYYSRRIKEKDGYPVSFSIGIDKASLKIQEFCLLDEEFGQPHLCGKEEYPQIEECIRHLVNKNLFELDEPIR